MTKHGFNGRSQLSMPPRYGCTCGEWFLDLAAHLAEEQKKALDAECEAALQQANGIQGEDA